MEQGLSLLSYQRRKTRVVDVGDVGIGGNNPIRVQSMTITDTMDTQATVDEVVRLMDVGCEIVRITAPSIREAENLKQIKAELTRRGVSVPLVADIHYTPNAALIAAEHVEKVRINPGNYADKKKFEQREYTDEEYEQELQRIEQRFKPLVLKCKELGRAMRIGTNHGSLSDRIMNRYGDTANGMVESALEFVRICEKLDYYEIILSMKASNPLVAIQAYRLLAARMDELGMNYPFHLGVTEAGDGEEGRIKSAIGIGALLEDGIGDTIRVSLTEDPVAEVPVAFHIARKYNEWGVASRESERIETEQNGTTVPPPNPFVYSRRETLPCNMVYHDLGSEHLPRVELTIHQSLADLDACLTTISEMLGRNRNGKLRMVGQNGAQDDFRCETVHVGLDNSNNLGHLKTLKKHLVSNELWLPLAVDITGATGDAIEASRYSDRVVYTVTPTSEVSGLQAIIRTAQQFGRPIEWKISLAETEHGQRLSALGKTVERLLECCGEADYWNVLFSLSVNRALSSIVGPYRYLAGCLDTLGANLPVLLNYGSNARFDAVMLDASTQLGSLLCDGIGDAIKIEASLPPRALLSMSYNILQATRLRISKTEFISCPSCGRTLFNLQTTTERIKSKTAHLKGVKIAIMGCIVNGPGEMADADFGYVGAGPQKVNLFVGKDCVKRNIPEEMADEQLIELIKSQGQWVEP